MASRSIAALIFTALIVISSPAQAEPSQATTSAPMTAAPATAADSAPPRELPGYTLEDLYPLALARADKIKISEEELFIAETGIDMAKSALRPRLSAFGDHTQYTKDKRSSTGSIRQPDSADSWGMRLDQSISLGGRELTALDIARKNTEKNRFDLNSVKEAYLYNVAVSYYDALRAEKNVDISQANVRRLTTHRDEAKARLDAGEATKTAVLRAEAELSGARSTLTRAVNDLRMVKAVLARLVGLDEGLNVRESAHLSETGHDSPSLASLQEEATVSRPELKSLAMQMKISDEQIKYARGSYWPTLSVEAVYSRQEEDPAPASLNRESIYGGVRLNFPFYEGGLRKAEVREAEARRRQAFLEFEDVRKEIGIEVERAFLDFMTQKGVMQSLEDQLGYAEDNFKAVSRQFENGLATSTDIMDANTLLVTAQRQLADARYGYHAALTGVKRATGTLLKTAVNSKSSKMEINR